jgi:hypothetical protein
MLSGSFKLSLPLSRSPYLPLSPAASPLQPSTSPSSCSRIWRAAIHDVCFHGSIPVLPPPLPA